MKRDWLTLAFGVALVGAVVGLSLRQNITPAPGESPQATGSAAQTAGTSDGTSAPPPEAAAGGPGGPPAERPRNRPAAPAASPPVQPAPPVRLNATIPVVHRHGMGSCQGVLEATAKGLSYETANKSDAFTVAFADMDEFEVDYLKRNLRVRRRAGRTWNFTNDSADVLFVFHRDVTKAREKLSGR